MFSAEKMYTYLRGYAMGAGMRDSLRALSFARDSHEGQFRASGEPYVVHPLTMACNALSLNIRDDEVIATMLLHDVCEECDVSPDDLPVSEPVRRSVSLLTYHKMQGETKDEARRRYYEAILVDRAATLTKLVDRCHNVSSMAGAFSRDRLVSYIEETRAYVLPLLREAKRLYPEDADAIFALKYHMTSVVDSIEATMRVYEGS